LLLASEDSVLDVALSCGFQSHEVFCRAFRRRFGMTPRDYRKRGFAQNLNTSQAKDHVRFARKMAPCLGLYRMKQEPESEEHNMTYSVTRKELAPQPVLVVRRRVKRSEIAPTIAQALPLVFAYAERHGIALAGLPFTRYIEIGPGLITMEPGMRIAASGGNLKSADSPGDDGVLTATLPGGPAATTTHIGPYEGLPDAYASIQQWMEGEGLSAAGAPWECYITDPAEHPNPKDWKTEVFWPLG
jgi:AraC family transcriptional regulator